jgi:tRNA-dihydrouridine synthase B
MTAANDNLLEFLLDESEHPVCAAPLAGWTDAPYRKILRRCGTRHLWIPFISTHAVANAKSKNHDEYVSQVENEKTHVQIFGAVPEICATASKILEEAGARSIDFNAGCSVPKIHKSGGGSALLRDLDLLNENLKAVVESVEIPVSLKTRIGYSVDDRSGIEACRIAADLGCAWVTLHGRTARQGFTGEADWEAIASLVNELPIPVIGNGDIAGPEDAVRMFETTGCAGVMIGRGIMGDPWLVGDCENYIRNGNPRPDRNRSDIASIMLEHQRAVLDQFADKRRVWEFRKHIAKYLRNYPQVSKLRGALVRENDPDEVARMIREFGEGRPPEDIIGPE